MAHGCRGRDRCTCRPCDAHGLDCHENRQERCCRTKAERDRPGNAGQVRCGRTVRPGEQARLKEAGFGALTGRGFRRQPGQQYPMCWFSKKPLEKRQWDAGSIRTGQCSVKVVPPPQPIGLLSLQRHHRLVWHIPFSGPFLAGPPESSRRNREHPLLRATLDSHDSWPANPQKEVNHPGRPARTRTAGRSRTGVSSSCI